MADKWLEEIRKKISCPQLGDEHYGEWGILTKHQRFTIKRMLDFIEGQEAYINRLRTENEELKREGDVSIEDIHSLSNRVNELVEENEGLRADSKRLKKVQMQLDDMMIMHHIIKAEAYKEFAESLKKQMYQSSDWSHGEHPFVVEESDIDNTLYELVGDSE